jgi:hypothetical protein
MWESVLRRIPWHGLRNAQIVCGVGLRGERLPLDEIEAGGAMNLGFKDIDPSQLCTECFAEDPSARPTFNEICGTFTSFMQRILSQ